MENAHVFGTAYLTSLVPHLSHGTESQYKGKLRLRTIVLVTRRKRRRRRARYAMKEASRKRHARADEYNDALLPFSCEIRLTTDIIVQCQQQYHCFDELHVTSKLFRSRSESDERGDLT